MTVERPASGNSAGGATLSAIIATKGRPDDLSATLESLSRCVPAPAEVVIVDGDHGRSAESVVEVARGRAGSSALRYVASPAGLTLQRNRGVREARGDVLVFLDDDVDVDPQLFAVLEGAYRDPAVVGATGLVLEGGERRFGNKSSAARRLLFRGEEGTMTRFGYPRRLQDLHRERDIEFMQGCLMSGRRKAVEQVGFDERLPGYGLAEDEDFSYRLSRVGRVRYLPDAVVDHKNTGFRSTGTRRFNRDVVANRTYLFRKNFRPTPLARLQFAGLIAVLVAHRALNREWDGVRGLLEGALVVRRSGRPRPSRPVTPAIAFVASHSRLGGSERYLELLMGGLGQAWVHDVICLQDGPFVERLRLLGYRPLVMPAGARAGMLPAALSLRRRLLGRPPDLVHANGVKAALVAVLATAGTGVPVLWVKHDFSWDGPLARAIGTGCRMVVAPSRVGVETFGSRLRGRTRVVPNGIPEPEADRDEARPWLRALAAGAPVVALLGSLHPVKGHLALLEATAGVVDIHPDLRVVLVGGEDPSQPAYAQRLRDRVAGLGLETTVRFLGHRADAAQIIAGADLVVVPSGPDERGMGKEGFGLVGVEAMFSGTPVVAFADGALPEVLGDCAEFVEPGDNRALGEAILRVLADEARAAELARCGRRRAHERYRLPVMIERMRECYAEALAQA